MKPLQKQQYFIKIVMDKLVSSILLLILCTVILLISVLIIIDSKGPVIFKQQRIGRNGEEFTIYKFRTMYDNAVNIGRVIFTSKNDTRITRVGGLLRKTSLDEIPQLINVIKGEMSFVGPRPPLVQHPKKYDDYTGVEKLRFSVLP